MLRTVIRISSASLAFPDWPLFDGRLLPEGGKYQYIHFLHRVTAAGVGVIILAVAVYTRRSQGQSRTLVSLSNAAVALYAAQVVVGAGNIWSKLNDGIAAAHLALGVLLWITLVLLSILGFYLAEPGPRVHREAGARDRKLARE